VLEGDVQAAQKAWKEAQAAYRNGLGKVPNSSDLAVRLHAVLTADGQNAEAAKLSDGWLKAHPKELGLPLYLANAALTRKDYATAATLYRRMLEVQPNNAAFLNDLAWALGQLGDANAIGYAEKANQLAPNQPAMMDTLGMLQVQQGQVEKGTELLRKAVALAPQAGEIRLNFARALIKSGDKRGARAELETLLKLGDTFRQHAEVNELLKTL
jgi:Flp pilus assembly protein TadD